MSREKWRLNPLVAVLAALAALFFIFPLIGLVTGAPWGHITSVITSQTALQALELSIIASLSSTAIALAFGFPLAWLLARGQFPGRPLESATGVTLPFSLAGVVVAESFVAMPFFVITVESGLRSMNRRLEDAARSLGASRRTVFVRVTLPLIWPSLAAGLVLTWARALGEFGATITFAGNLPGVTQTMPLAIYISQSSNMTDEAIALSLILVLVSLVVMVFRRDRSGAQ
jgi:molybdate transport system permease protein